MRDFNFNFGSLFFYYRFKLIEKWGLSLEKY